MISSTISLSKLIQIFKCVVIFGISKSQTSKWYSKYRNWVVKDNEILWYRVFCEFKAVEIYLDFKGQYHNDQKPLKDERVWSDAKVR